MKTHDLTSQYDSRKSFYGKAKVIKDNGLIKLQSYNTIVASLNLTKKELKLHGYFSPTTARHIREFCYQYFPFHSVPSKQQMENKETLTLKQ
ncbi:MAG: hypothetical protein KDD03_09230 [Gelidibacter sp.]|nr:hypothetical protein [Gelidibacter sp.]